MKVTHLCPTLWDPIDYTVQGILQARILEWVAFPFSRGSFQPEIKSRSPTLQVDSLPVEPQGKPKNTGAGSLSLLQYVSGQGEDFAEFSQGRVTIRFTSISGLVQFFLT